MTPGDIRQFRREYQERADDVRYLIEDLQEAGRETDDPERLFLSGNEEVPSGFRKLVEEYYRSLARRSSGTIPPDRN